MTVTNVSEVHTLVEGWAEQVGGTYVAKILGDTNIFLVDMEEVLPSTFSGSLDTDSDSTQCKSSEPRRRFDGFLWRAAGSLILISNSTEEHALLNPLHSFQKEQNRY